MNTHIIFTEGESMNSLESIVSKIVLYITILLGIGIFLLVWGIIYESLGSVTISSVIKYEGLTPLYVLEQSPFGLLLGWIPAYVASVVFIILFVTILEILLPMVIVLFPLIMVMLLWMWS